MFSHTDLNLVDPNFQPLPQDTYNLQVMKAALAKYQGDNGSGEQEEKERVDVVLAVTGHPEFTGRRVFETIWPGDFGLKTLRRLMDATGIPFDGSWESWLERLVLERGEFRVGVTQVPDVRIDKATGQEIPNPKTVRPDGKPSMKNRIDWRTIAPAA